MKKVADLKVPKGPRRGREIPLIGVADVSLRGLESPEEGEQKTFWSPSFVKTTNAAGRLFCIRYLYFSYSGIARDDNTSFTSLSLFGQMSRTSSVSITM